MPPAAPPRQRGFTLLELIAVIVIIAVLATVVGLSINLGDDGRALKRETQRLVLVVNRASDHALYENLAIGLRLVEEGYFFVTPKPREPKDDERDENAIGLQPITPVGEEKTQEWQLALADGLQPHLWDSAIEVDLDLEGAPVVLDSLDSLDVDVSEIAALVAAQAEESEVQSSVSLSEQQLVRLLKPQLLFLPDGEVLPGFRLIIRDEEGTEINIVPGSVDAAQVGDAELF